jgi:succinate dehydrogenase/fumarate reductase cytochrome b subunit
MTNHDFTVIVTCGVAIFYAIDLIEKGRDWLQKAHSRRCNRWVRILKECVVWLLLIGLGSCVFTHLALTVRHGAV